MLRILLFLFLAVIVLVLYSCAVASSRADSCSQEQYTLSRTNDTLPQERKQPGRE